MRDNYEKPWVGDLIEKYEWILGGVQYVESRVRETAQSRSICGLKESLCTQFTLGLHD